MDKTILNRQKINLIFLGIAILGLALRAYQLNQRDFWCDEALTASRISSQISRLGLEYRIENYMDKHAPLYFFGLKAWSFLLGINDFSLRFFSVIFGFLCILLVYKTCSLLLDQECALFAAGFLSFSPFHLWYAQEARMFTFASFLILVNFYFFIKLLKKDDYRYWLGYGLSLLACLFTTYFTVFFLLSQVIAVVAVKEYRRAAVKLAAASFAAGIIFAFFYLRQFYHQSVVGHRFFWLPKTKSIAQIQVTLENFLLGYNGVTLTYAIAFLFLLTLMFYAFLKSAHQERIMLFVFSLLPLILIFIVSKFFPIYVDRHLIIFSPFVYFVLAKGIFLIRHKLIRAVFILPFAFVLISSIFNYYQGRVSNQHLSANLITKSPVQPLVRAFLAHKKEADALAFSSMALKPPFDYYLSLFSKSDFYHTRRFFLINPKLKPFFGEVFRLANPGLQPRELGKSGILVYPDKTVTAKKRAGRLWLFSLLPQRSGYSQFDPNVLAVKNWLDAAFPRREELIIEDVSVTIYELNNQDNELRKDNP